MKWWFSDYDGTINLHEESYLEQDDLDYINYWIKTGNKFVIASGRMNHEISSVLNEHNIPYDFLITNNGACVYDDKGTMIEHLPIPLGVRQDIIDILETLKDRGYIAYCIENHRILLTSNGEQPFRTKELTEQPKPDQKTWDEGIKKIATSNQLNIVYFYIDAKEMPSIRAAFKHISGIKIVRTGSKVLEIINEKVSKAHGIQVLQKIMGFDNDDVFTSGDGENDIEMLAWTKHSFAMSSADDHVKSHAKHIIDRVSEIRKFENEN